MGCSSPRPSIFAPGERRDMPRQELWWKPIKKAKLGQEGQARVKLADPKGIALGAKRYAVVHGPARGSEQCKKEKDEKTTAASFCRFHSSNTSTQFSSPCRRIQDLKTAPTSFLVRHTLC